MSTKTSFSRRVRQGFFLGVVFVSHLWAKDPIIPKSPPHGYMPIDSARLEKWDRDRRKQPFTEFRPVQKTTQSMQAGTTSSVNWLDDVGLKGASRDQGRAGNCWVWASSAMAEVALKATYGYADKLSIEFVDSLVPDSAWNQGGTLGQYCGYINEFGQRLIPESNANANYVNGFANLTCRRGLVPTSAIQKSPAYSHPKLQGKTVPTQKVGQATAIANIKNLLDQHKVVGFSFFCDFGSAKGFVPWWSNYWENALWSEPVTGPTEAPNIDWGGHMVPIIGYDDSDPSPANHYWIALNSWGLTDSRPNGLFRIPMAMNYDATFTLGSGSTHSNYIFETMDLEVDHPAATVPVITMTSSTSSPKLGQPLTFFAEVTGYPPHRYQWQMDEADIPGATSATYTIPYLTGSEGGHSYRVVVSNTVDGAPIQTPSQAIVVPSMAGQQQILHNPGFEDGNPQTAWTAVTTLDLNNGPFDQPVYQSEEGAAHSGQWDVFLGYPAFNVTLLGTLDQTLTVPEGPGSVTLSYWLSGNYWNTGSFPGNGTLSASILDAATGELLRPINYHHSDEIDHLLWTQDRFGLGDLKGHQITIHFDWWGWLAYWRLDDFAVVLDPSDPAPLPSINAFDPPSGNPGDTITLTGSGFTGATHVDFNGFATSFKVDSDSHITTQVPDIQEWYRLGVSSGPILVNTPGGSAFSAVPFRVLRPLITNLNPMRTKRGTQVVLDGSGFTGCTTVAFTGVAGIGTAPALFVVDSDSQITATVPAEATSGSITVVTPYGRSLYGSLFTVLQDGTVSVTISPRLKAVLAGTQVHFDAKVTGDIDQTVTWYSTETIDFMPALWEPMLTIDIAPSARGTLEVAAYWANLSSWFSVFDSLTIPVKNIDFLGTGTPNVLDMLELASVYGGKEGDSIYNTEMDLDGNGVIDDHDVNLFKLVF